MSVFAADGSKFNLPATNEIREKFDPESGLDHSGKGHYPQCLVSTIFDVFRRLPIARTVVGIKEASEREELKKLIPYVPLNSLWLFDRGYPSYEIIHYLMKNYNGYFIFRCPASSTFSAVENFVKSKKKEDVIWIDPSKRYLSKISKKERSENKAIRLRVIRLVSPDGTVSVLLTNLFDKKEFKGKEIINLYFRRWEVENYYRDEKITMNIEKFHGKTVNSILQELYASMIMSVISRVILVLTSEKIYSGEKEFQFKNSLVTIASDAALLVSEDPEKALSIFEEVITEISRVKYHRPKKPRSFAPRVSKTPENKWRKRKNKAISESKQK